MLIKKYSWKFCSNCSHEPIELGAKDENHEKAVPVRDKENKRIFNSFIEPASPNWARYWLICSKALLVLLQILDRALHPKHTSNDWSTDSGAVQARRGDPVRCLLTFSSAAADVRFRHVQEEEKQWRKMEAYDGPRICSKYLFALKRSRSYRNALTICNFVPHEIFSHSGKNTGIQIQTMFVGKHLDTEIEHCRMVRL